MPIYRLEPIEGTEGYNAWWASTLSPTTVWVQANNPDHARQRMHLATTTFALDKDGLYAPWHNAALVRCIEDASWDVPPNTALFANGKITLKLKQGI